jgi:hypothetical protein
MSDVTRDGRGHAIAYARLIVPAVFLLLKIPERTREAVLCGVHQLDALLTSQLEVLLPEFTHLLSYAQEFKSGFKDMLENKEGS